MLKVDSSLQNRNLQFKGANSDKQNYPKTRAGLYTGISMAAAVEAFAVGSQLYATKSLKNFPWKNNAIAAAVFVGSGALIDAVINHKLKKGEKNNALGKKCGTALGGGLGIGASLLLLGKSTFTKAGGTLAAIITGLSTIGGFILGAITDKFANKKAKNF